MITTGKLNQIGKRQKTVYVAFRLSMPGNNAWDGRWSGERRLYVRVRAFRPGIAEGILSRPDYGYSFGDGWFASVNVAEVDGTEKRRLDKQSAGFCGYEWMIDSIVKYGKIIAE